MLQAQAGATSNEALTWELLHDAKWRMPTSELEALWGDATGATGALLRRWHGCPCCTCVVLLIISTTPREQLAVLLTTAWLALAPGLS